MSRRAGQAARRSSPPVRTSAQSREIDHGTGSVHQDRRPQGRGQGQDAQGRDRRALLELGRVQLRLRPGRRGAGAGKCNVQDVSFTKYIDKASPDLMLACCKGKHYDTATLVVRKAGTTPLEYVTLTLSEVMVTNVSTGGSGGEDRLTENVSLNFAKIKFDYKEQTDKGAAGATPSMTWDIAQNVSE